LVVGCDEEGNSTETTDTVNAIKGRITWGITR
jgi:hypothetical protein